MTFRIRCFVLLILTSIFVRERAFAQDGASTIVVSEQAKQIHFRGYVFDGHNDLPWEMRKVPRRFDQWDIRNSQPKLHTDIDRLKLGNVGAQFWSVYVPAETRGAGTAYRTTIEQIEIVREMIRRYPDIFQLALDADGVREARQAGKIASLIGMEGGHSIEDSIQNLRRLHAMGARYMTLTHSDTLAWADAATDDAEHSGLTPFGEEVVREMNRLGMLVDLSHVSPDTMHDALDITKAPIIFSHSSARAVANHPRNVPDDVLKRLPKNGGVVMINFFSGFVVPDSAEIMREMFQVRRALQQKYPNSKESVEKEYKEWQLKHPYPAGEASIVVDHIDHVRKVAGIDHVGLGSDYDGITKTPRGIEDVSTYPVLTELMLRRGYTEEDIHKVLYKNALRILEACGKVSTALAK
ncbi:MAG: dipeptidase [Planctomycetes bacterium]|nr:dipeptidase [Planctomycetota bacterium]